MNESKVVIYGVFPLQLLSPNLPYSTLVRVVTHADYKALEDRVRELVEADRAYDACLEHADVPEEAVERRRVALGAFA